jgi:hypothetical protein
MYYPVAPILSPPVRLIKPLKILALSAQQSSLPTNRPPNPREIGVDGRELRWTCPGPRVAAESPEKLPRKSSETPWEGEAGTEITGTPEALCCSLSITWLGQPGVRPECSGEIEMSRLSKRTHGRHMGGAVNSCGAHGRIGADRGVSSKAT